MLCLSVAGLVFGSSLQVNADDVDTEDTPVFEIVSRATTYKVNQKENSNIFVSETSDNSYCGQVRVYLPNSNYEVSVYNFALGTPNRYSKKNITSGEYSGKYRVIATYNSTSNASRGSQVFYVTVKNNTTGENKEYYVVNKEKVTYTRGAGYIFTDPSARLLNKNNEVIDSATITFAANTAQVKEYISDSSDEGVVSLNFTRPHQALTVYSINTDAMWMKPDCNYYRVNGSDAKQFDAGNDTNDTSIKSGPIILKKGWNIIEAYSYGGNINLGTQLNLEEGQIKQDLYSSESFVWLINYQGDEADQQKILTDNVKLEKIRAVTYVDKYQETFKDYSVTVDKENDDYSIDLPNNISYPYILLQVKTDDPGATVTMPEDMVTSSVGPIYSIKVVPGVTENIPVTVKSSSGTTEKIQNIKLNWKSSDCNIEELILSNGSLEEDINDADTSYLVNVVDNNNIIYKIKVSEGASVKIDSEQLSEEDGYFSYTANASDSKTRITVIAEDGITKKIYTFVNQTVSTYFGISDSTKKMAKELLDSTWYNRSDKNASGGYWGVFKKAATGENFDNTFVYDVTTHEISDETSAAKSYAAIILELVIVGENPYNFNGVNYVEKLENVAVDNFGGNSFGAYGADVWAYIGLKAAGAEDFQYYNALKTRVKEYALDSSNYLEMRSWAWAALGDELSQKEKIKLIEEVRDEYLWTDGEDAGLFVAREYQNNINSNCHGCVLTGIVGLNYDVENYKLDDEHSPLITMKSRFLDTDNTWKYNNDPSSDIPSDDKDIIVGLGDIITGDSVFHRYQLTKDDLTSLLSIAQTVLETGSRNNNCALQEAYDAAVKVKSQNDGFGEEYYNLYDAVAAIDRTKVNKPNARMCSINDSNIIDQVISMIDTLSIDDISLENHSGYDAVLESYNALSSLCKSYVSNADKLEKITDKLEDQEKVKDLVEKIDNIPSYESITLESESLITEIKKSFDALSDDLKASVTNSSTLIDAFNKISALKVEKEINELPDNVNSDNVQMIKDAQNSYNALDDEVKKLISAGTIEKLTTMIAKMQEYEKQLSSSGESTEQTVGSTQPSSGESVNQTTNLAKPAKVTKLTIKSKTGKKVQLTWKKVSKASGYQIYMKNSKNGKYKLIKTIKNAKLKKYVVPKAKLKKNKTYYFKVRAYKAYGNLKVYGKFSSVKKVRVK